MGIYIGSTEPTSINIINANTEVYVGSKKVRPTGGGSGWQPGANTIVYYPLDSVNTVNDLSGNNYNLTNVNNQIIFGTYQGVDCAEFNNNNSSNRLKLTSGQIFVSGDQTRSCWMYLTGGYSYTPRIFSTWNGGDCLYSVGYPLNGTNIIVWSADDRNGIQYITNSWHLYTITCNFSTGQYTGYVDGVLSNTWTGNPITPNTGIVIGGGGGSDSSSGAADKYNGGLSNLIYEDRIRTAEEIADYFNQTKSLYGIS